MEITKYSVKYRGYEIEMATVDGEKYVYLFRLGNPDEEEVCVWTGPITEFLIIRKLFEHLFYAANGQKNVAEKAFPAHQVDEVLGW